MWANDSLANWAEDLEAKTIRFVNSAQTKGLNWDQSGRLQRWDLQKEKMTGLWHP